MILIVTLYCLLLGIAFRESIKYIHWNRFICCRSLTMSAIQVNRIVRQVNKVVTQANKVGSYHNHIIISDDESVGHHESGSDSYTSQHIITCYMC